MTANELADLLMDFDSGQVYNHATEIATMLRQQQAQIEALKKKQEEALREVKTSWTAISPVSGIPRESAHQLYDVLKDIMK